MQSPPCIFIPLFIDWCQNGACAIPWNESVLFILLIFWRENQFFYWLKRSLETKPSSTFKFVDILKRKSIAFCLLADVTYKNVTFEKRSHLSNKIATQTSSSQSQIESHWVQATYMCNAHFAPCSNAILLENISNFKHSLLCKYNPAVWQVVVPPAQKQSYVCGFVVQTLIFCANAILLWIFAQVFVPPAQKQSYVCGFEVQT